MAIPTRIPIMYEPDYRTHWIGSFDGGQFFGSVAATVADPGGAASDQP
jgi:formate hydrogenlyase regulatory protein HycA